MSSQQIEHLLQEDRVIPIPPAFSGNHQISSFEDYKKKYEESIHQPNEFWSKEAKDFHWFKPFSKVSTWNEPHVKWFEDGETNISFNSLDRHLQNGGGDQTAIVFESEKGETQKLSYSELHRRVCQFSNLLESQGIAAGDRVAIYMPLIPEAIIAIQACARIGAVHSVVFGGFSAKALSERIEDAEAKAVITADGGHRRGKIIELKKAVDEAVENITCVTKVFVFRWLNNPIEKKSRDLWVNDVISKYSQEHHAKPLPSEHPLFILYTSGSTGKPKGVLHSTAGYMLYSGCTYRYIFDHRKGDLFWCTADVGWITGHSYVAYGPLLNGAQIFLYEGAPDHPGPERFWQMIERHQINIFYTAPTAIRAFMKWGDEHINKYNLSSLRLLGSVGEPINPEAWMWYFKTIGKENCPIVDTWWQTETGGIMLTTLPGVHEMKPGAAGLPFFGVQPAIVDENGVEARDGNGGFLVIKRPWPSLMRSIYGDDDRYREQYWEKIPNVYFAGDGARKDDDGYFWVMGRIDDVVNVAGHRLGTAEVESVLVAHPQVAEAAVVGVADEIKGESIVAFVSLEADCEESESVRKELNDLVVKEIGAIARPSKLAFADSLPKTRSGKIMRRLLRSVASGDHREQDTSTLEDPGVLEKLRKAIDY